MTADDVTIARSSAVIDRRYRYSASPGELGLQSAVAPFALLECDDGFVQMPLVEVGPKRVCDPDFRVGDLPEKKVTDPELATGSNQQIRVRQPRCIKVRCKFIFLNTAVFRSRPPAVSQNPIYRVNDLRTAAVIQSHTEHYSLVTPRTADS